MPCHHPLQAVFSLRADGKKNITFSNINAKLFHMGVKPLGDNNISIPCGKCMGCRLERSRQWAVRCLHESKMYDNNCFITLTYDDDNLAKYVPDGSLNREHFQLFMKRLRTKYSNDKIRVFYCGEYGENLGRPHFHACLFNFDFPDKKFWKRSCDEKLYISDALYSLWPFGFHGIGSVTFESAGYIARYCTKKINGDMAKAHYQGRTPEFVGMSLKPGIGKPWLDKFGKTDVFPHDEVIVRGAKCKPPRYYDKVLESIDPERFADIRESRQSRAEEKEDDNTYSRLLIKEKCLEARFKKLVRTIERS